MKTHRRARRRISGRARALLSLGAVASLATGLSVQGTFAFWTDSATLTTGSFTSGTLDVTLNGAASTVGQGPSSTTLTSFTLTNMVPGESRAADFPVANNGTAPFTYTASGTAAGTAAGLYQFQVFVGSASNPAPTGNAARTGTCSGAALTAAPVTLNGTAASLTTAARTLVPTGTAGTVTETLCVVATLPTAVDNTGQSKTATASIVFDAKQVGAP